MLSRNEDKRRDVKYIDMHDGTKTAEAMCFTPLKEVHAGSPDCCKAYRSVPKVIFTMRLDLDFDFLRTLEVGPFDNVEMIIMCVGKVSPQV